MVSDNNCGISLLAGARANKIVHNNFLSNILPATDEGFNSWDDGYPSGGNFWSGYPGDDANNDGIGDVPYTIAGGSNQDRYPLMSLWDSTFHIPMYVDDDFDDMTPGWQINCFDTIQDGIDAVIEHGTIFVSNGVYYENITIDKPVKLLGEDKNSTIIDGGENELILDVVADRVTISGFTIQNSGDWYQDIGLKLRSDHNTITDNIFTDNSNYGIQVTGYGHNNVISENIFMENDCALLVFSSPFNEIIDNVFINNTVGILIDAGCSNAVIGNIISDNEQQGIYLCYEANDNIISENTVIGSQDGIFLEVWCFDNIISKNTISNHSLNGLYIDWSFGNQIFENEISNNRDGLWFEYMSNYNSIYHNNFINNVNHAYDDLEDDCDNAWDNGYPSGGNYWDDYAGSDADGDGIGDTPYLILSDPPQSRDYYPLMEPLFFTVNGDMNGDCYVDLTDFTIFASAYNSHIGDTRYKRIADMDLNGVVDLTDFTLFASNYGKSCEV
jgi:parallel beta-helix repeat protein